jgi:hypothetical protein
VPSVMMYVDFVEDKTFALQEEKELLNITPLKQ